MFWEMGYSPRWIDIRKLKENLDKIKLLYVPECFIISNENIELIKDFANKGGIVVAEEGFALRKKNTWLNYPWPEAAASEFFGVKISERISTVYSKATLDINGFSVPASGYISSICALDNAEVIGKWNDSRPGAVKKGNTIFIGTSLGASFYENCLADKTAYVSIMKQILKVAGIENKDSEGLYIRTLKHNETELQFVFNKTEKCISTSKLSLKPFEIKIYNTTTKREIII
jgi:hypothetical protein